MATKETHTSHSLAAALRELANKLDNAPEFPLAWRPCVMVWFNEKKYGFLSMVRLIGGKKEGNDNYEFKLTARIGESLDVDYRVNRSQVCRKVTKTETVTHEVWECDPLLTQAEEQEIANGNRS